MDQAVACAQAGIEAGSGGPFGAAIVRTGSDEFVALEHNRVVESCDPTAHAEILAIRAACKKLATFHLTGYELVTTCEPCPMCLAAAHWARVDRIVFGATRHDAAAVGFGDAAIYRAMQEPTVAMQHIESPSAMQLLALWQAKPNRAAY